mgnify:CR=1 FL=1
MRCFFFFFNIDYTHLSASLLYSGIVTVVVPLYLQYVMY